MLILRKYTNTAIAIVIADGKNLFQGGGYLYICIFRFATSTTQFSYAENGFPLYAGSAPTYGAATPNGLPFIDATGAKSEDVDLSKFSVSVLKNN